MGIILDEKKVVLGEIGQHADYMFEACDGNDYAIAVMAGIIAGVIDVFFVGSPEDTKMGKATDKLTEDAVIRLAKLDGWKPEKGKGDISSAIRHFEKDYKVNYEQITSKGSGEEFSMSARNHHFKSLGHAPDLIGLFFSVLDQFSMKATYVSDGRIIRIDTLDKDNPLQAGDSFGAKVFCGVCNWFFHIISDVAGATGGSKGNGKMNRGSGVGIPGMELFNLCDFGSYRVGNDTMTLAQSMVKVYESGYDLRFGMAMAFPVILEELLIRVLWVIKARYVKRRDWRECIPNSRHGDLRVMLLVGNATLCVIDGVDASIRSNGDFVRFVLRLNYVAWMRLIKLVIKEVALRIDRDLEEMSETLRRINDDLAIYLEQLRSVDIDAYEESVKSMVQFETRLMRASSEMGLTEVLYGEMEIMGLQLPFCNHQEFDSFMQDSNTRLIL